MRYTILVFIALIGTAAVASDDTQRLLDAPRVRDVLQLHVAREKDSTIVTYRADNRFAGVLHDDDTLATPGTIELTYKNFNPFKVTVSATQALTPDPNQKAIGDFLDALTGFAKGIVPSTTKAGANPAATSTRRAGGAAGDCLDALNLCSQAANQEALLAQALLPVGKLSKASQAAKDKALKAVQATQDKALLACQAQLRECAECGAFDAAVASAMRLATSPPAPKVGVDDLQRWVDTANGRAGILDVRDNDKTGVHVKRELVAKDITSLQEAKGQLSALASASANCGANVATLSSLYTANDLTPLIDANKRLLASLDAILNMLGEYASRTWRDGDTHDSDLVIASVEGNPVQQNTTTVTFRLQKYTIDKTTNTIAASTDVEATRKFVVRRYRQLVPEVGVAAVYNDVQYPKYAVKGTAGAFTVGKTTDTSNVDAAITLNLLCNCVGGSFLYPGVQLGVSKSKDYPGILGGIVLRFAYPKQLSFAIGRMMTWYKDLDGTLHVDGPVASDADLQAHLKRRRAPTALYLAAQFNF